MSRAFEQLVQDALHQQRVNEHASSPNDFFNVDEHEYRLICMQVATDPFVSDRELVGGTPTELCGLLINRSELP